ncbi:Golgin candidate 1 [Tetrabaena socialis]|uniref:Golgin candidate 1 n=1 Tax=Tetrabaena socialis TaxID=47790 RepID=A0A2J7ZSV1_9CHLO|nr:Golgin candidate 1 [Tetrabaena socialis]|eukprot:PNH03320.1 Golgin candidate 1 [Tetrabaena socialis]
MASWLASQLRAAEGLLDAVDKTVSRTPYPAATPVGAAPAFSAAASGVYTHAGAASAVHAQHPSSSAGGFTVKVDAPIPFGSRPAAPAGAGAGTAAATSYSGAAGLSRHSSQANLAPASAPAAPYYQLAPAAAPYGSNGTGGGAAATSWAAEERSASGASAATSADAAAQQAGRGAGGSTGPLPLQESSSAARDASLPDAGGAVGGAAGNARSAPNAAAGAAPPSGTSQQTPAPSPAPPAPVSAPAPTTLASATSSAVTHSLSFFNLVLEDPSDPPPADAGGASASAAGNGGGGLQQQLQALSRTCEQLRKRLDLSRVENEQLEDMLARAEVKVQQEAAQVAVLREELAAAQHQRAAGEGGLAAQLAVARSSLADVAGRYEASQRSVLVLEGRLAALEESSRRLAAHHSDREGNIVDALRAELSSAEARLASERKAHQASRAAAASREADLEQQVAGNTAALTDLTRSLEDANRKGRGRVGSVAAGRCCAWDTAQLESQLREVSDMLYLKQTQLERLASEKAGQQLKTERELDNVRQELAKLVRQTVQQGGGGGGGRGGADGGGAGGGGVSHDVIPMDALGEPYQRLARHTKVGKAVKAAANFLDSTASTTSFVLRQYPLARLCLFAYVALIHLYLYMLTARMQRLATHFESISAPIAT